MRMLMHPHTHIPINKMCIMKHAGIIFLSETTCFWQVLDVMFSSIVPLYNAVVWLLRLLLNDVVIDSLISNVPSIKEFGIALGSLCKHSALEISPYLTSMATTCNYARDGDFCYEAGNNRVIDIITIMADVRRMTAAVSKILISVCASGSAPLNILLFPFMDINFAKALHNIVNAALYTVFQLPSVTAQRCMNHGLGKKNAESGGAILLCMPDFNQPINMLVAGLRNLGIMVDNWIDVSSVIAQRSLGLGSADETDCESKAMSLTPAFYSRQLFDAAGDGSGNNRQKIVVGLTQGLYAVTDGVHAQYFNHYDSVESIASPNVWPIEIDTSFGVAAVTYRSGSGSEERDGMGDTTTTMLGCRCTDNGGLPPMRIQCALALKTVAASSSYRFTQDRSTSSGGNTADSDPFSSQFQQVFDVVFQQRSTANYMSCNMAQISVQSVRWPSTRFSGRYLRFQND